MSPNLSPKIQGYTKALSKGLVALTRDEKNEIVAEISAHLHQRAAEGRLDEALAALGSPQQCAQHYLDELTIKTAIIKGGPARVFGTLLSLATKRLFAGIGLFFASIFLCISIAMILSAIVKIISPNTIGLWVVDGGMTFAFGAVDSDIKIERTEILGVWYTPVAVAIAVLAFLISQWTSRFFLKIMLGRTRLTPSASSS